MLDSSSQCIRPSDKAVSENMIAWLGRLPVEILLVLSPCDSNTKSGTDLFRDSQPKVVLPLNPWRIILVYRFALPWVPMVWGGPVCHPSYGEQIRAGNGTERSASGGCHPGADGFGALNPLEKSYSPFGPRRSSRKRGIDPPQSSRASSQGRTPRTFACHFYLHDRIGHSACLNIRLARLSDVRQHLLDRAHNQVVHCAVCGTTFPGRNTTEARRQRDAHARAATCQASPSPFNYPGITEDEDRQIREIARNTRSADYTEARRWFMIWDCLFPGEQRPVSPFLTDMPEIQRVSDWAGVIFSDTDRWLTLPNEPWTPDMSTEEQNARMSNFIQSFITEARDLVQEDSGPVDDYHGADNSSYINVDTDPSVATTNLGIFSLAGSDSNRPAGASRRSSLNPLSAMGSRRSSLNPLSATGSRRSSLNPLSATGPGQAPNSHTLGATEPSTGEQHAVIAPLPLRPLNQPTVDVPQDAQQHAAFGAAMGLDDPALPSRAFQGLSAEDLIFNSGFDMSSSMNMNDWPNIGNGWGTFSNDDAGPDNNYPPPEEDQDELGGRH